MKKNINKLSADFERMLNDEFQTKSESKPKSQDGTDNLDNCSKKPDKDNVPKNSEHSTDANRKDSKPK